MTGYPARHQDPGYIAISETTDPVPCELQCERRDRARYDGTVLGSVDVGDR
jgi:hypothetical protein